MAFPLLREISCFLFPAQHDFAEEDENAEEDEEPKHLGSAGKVGTDDGERAFAAAVRDGDDDDACQEDADDGLTDDEPRGKERAAPQTCTLRLLPLRLTQVTVDEVAEDRTDDERCLDDGREVDAHTDGERRHGEILRRAAQEEVDEDEHDADPDADVDVLPCELLRENALSDGRHEHCLRCGECLRGIHARTRQRAREPIRLIEEVEHGGDDERADHAADEERDLLTPRRCADEIAGLEILHIVIRDAGDCEDDRRGKDGGRRRKFLAARQREDAEHGAQRVHDERCNDDAEDADARDRAGGRADETCHIGAGGGNEEAHEDGDADADEGEDDFLTARDLLGADEGVEDDEQPDDGDGKDEPDTLHRHVDVHAVQTALCAVCACACDGFLYAVNDGASEAEQRPDRGDAHGARADEAHLLLIDGTREFLQGHAVGECTGDGEIGDEARPCDGDTDQHRESTRDADEVARADERRRVAERELRHAASDVEPCGEAAAEHLQAVREERDHASDGTAREDLFQSRAVLLAAVVVRADL